MKKLLFAALLLLLVGCTVNKKKDDPNDIVIDDPQIITLEANPTTGYDWDYTYDLEGIITLEKEYIADEVEEGIVGNGGVDVFTIKPIKEGKVTVTFVYQRSWDPSEDDEKVIYEITVDTSKQVEVKEIK